MAPLPAWRKMLAFGLLGALGCLAGWAPGELLLAGARALSPPGKQAAPSLVSHSSAAPAPAPAFDGRAGKIKPPPAPPPLPSVARVVAAPVPPELPKGKVSESAPAPPPTPEFARRLQREKAQTGDVQVSLLWNNFNDLDLHCIEPDGTEISCWRRRFARSGGHLDVDMNAHGRRSREPVENVFWPKGKAPLGRYKVYVDYFMQHDAVRPSPYKVSILAGGERKEFSGTIERGKRLVHEFELKAGGMAGRPALRLAVAKELEVLDGDGNALPVRIAREAFAGSVKLAVEGDLTGLSVEAVALPAGEDFTSLRIEAKGAREGKRELTLRASAEKGGPASEARFALTVLAPRVVLALPPALAIEREGKNELPVRVGRERFKGPVTLSVEGDLAGLAVPDATVPDGEDQAWLVLQSAGAAPGERELTVRAAAKGSAGAVGKFRLTVLPPVLHVALSPAAEVSSTGKNVLPVLVAREHFKGPVTLRAAGDLAGLTFAPVSLRADEHLDKMTFEAKGATPGRRRIKIEARAEGDLAVAVGEFDLTILPPALSAAPAHSAAGWNWLKVPVMGAWTALLAVGLALALVVGQNAYLKRSWLTPQQGALLAGGGLLAGLVAGGLGELLQHPALSGKALGFVAGWLLLGGLLGRGLAWFIPNLHGWKASAAGAAGGLLAALAFRAVSLLGADFAGRLAGALLLGFSIGLMVALVEMAFRSAWLEVVYGPREAGTVNLGPEPVSFGGDASSCTVFARGAAPRAYCFWFRGGKVRCEDVPSGEVRVLVPGQSLAIGKLRVTVRTAGASADATTVAARERPAPAPPQGYRGTIKPGPRRAPVPERPSVPPAPARAPQAVARVSTPGGPGCPTCGRKAPGATGKRYCTICERAY